MADTTDSEVPEGAAVMPLIPDELGVHLPRTDELPETEHPLGL